MKLMFLIPLLALTAEASAFDASFRADFPYKPQAAWEEKALAGIKKVSKKVTDTMWGQKGSLWIEVKRDGTDWEQAGRFFCNTLKGAGMPEKEYVILSFWRSGQVIEKVTCD